MTTQKRAAAVERNRGVSDRLGLVIIRARRAVWHAGARALAVHGQSILDWQLVAYLARTGPSSQREIAAAVAQHPAGVSRQLEELEKKGLTRRARDARDLRRSVVELTVRGEAWFRTYHSSVFGAVSEVLSPLTLMEQRTLTDLLEKAFGPEANSTAPCVSPPARR